MSDTPSGTPGDRLGSGPTGSDADAGAQRADTSHEQQQYAPPPGQQYPPPGQQQYQQPGQQYPPGQQYGGPPIQKGNGLAVAGLVLGILGVVFAFIPVIGVFFAFLFGLLAAIFGGIGLSRSKDPYRGGKGMAVAGLVLGLIAIVLGIGQIAFWGSVANDIENELPVELQEDLEQLEEDLEQIS